MRPTETARTCIGAWSDAESGGGRKARRHSRPCGRSAPQEHSGRNIGSPTAGSGAVATGSPPG